MNNRRNLYRILYVQPEAPLEIIKASYRSLMTQLKMHPDLGGDHESAVLINKAYAVLSDPKKRRQYDEILHSRKSQRHGGPGHETPTGTQQSSKSRSSGDDKPPPSAALRRCFFCGTEHAFTPRISKYCINCASPLATAQPITTKSQRELFGRRASPRTAKAGMLVIYPSWPHAGYSARLRDLSPSGISMMTGYSARIGQILKFNSDNLKGIARVVSVQANGANFLVHASFLTVEFVTKTGFFVAEKV